MGHIPTINRSPKTTVKLFIGLDFFQLPYAGLKTLNTFSRLILESTSASSSKARRRVLCENAARSCFLIPLSNG
ncbi:MAG: hypothetical protein ACJAS1_002381 [Oleiphilaceae bacterium]|jgi:hypothetical protein